MASLDAKVSEGAQLIKKKEYHAAIAILQSVYNSGVAASSTSQRAKSYAEKAMAHLNNDPYMALNIPRASTRGDVKKNYRKLALKYHPDKNEHTADLFKVIQVAYDTLKDKPTPKKGNAFSQPPPPPRSGPRSQRPQRRSGSTRTSSGHAHYPPSEDTTNSQRPQHKYNTAFNKEAYERFCQQREKEQKQAEANAKQRRGSYSARDRRPEKSFFRPANESSAHGTSHYGYPRPPPATECGEESKETPYGYVRRSRPAGNYGTHADDNAPHSARARAQPGFPGRVRPDDAPKSARGEAEKRTKYPFSQKYNEQYRQHRPRPTPTPDETPFDQDNAYYKQAEAAMKRFWETGEFPFDFAKDAPAKAAQMFAKMFANQPASKRKAFEDAFEARFNATPTWGATPRTNQNDAWAAPRKETTTRPPPSNPAPRGGLPTPRVTGLKVDATEDSSIVLTWNSVAQGVSAGLPNVKYELQFREFSAPHWSISSDTIRTTSVRKKGLAPGKRYEFRVRARSEGKEGPFSSAIAARTESGVPDAPSIATILEVTSTTARIVWTVPPCNGAAVRQYELEWRHVGSVYWKTASASLKGTDCRKKNLLPERQYEFRVRASNRVGFGPWSQSIHCTTLVAEPAQNESPPKAPMSTARPPSSPEEDSGNVPSTISPEAFRDAATLRNERAKRAKERAAKAARAARAKESKEEKQEEVTSEATKHGRPSEYYEMWDAEGNVYYWNAITGSDWNPPAWVDHYDDNMNVYYENTATGESRWEQPLDFIPIIRNQDETANITEDENTGGESPLDAALFSPGERKMMAEIYETSSPKSSPFLKGRTSNSERAVSSPSMYGSKDVFGSGLRGFAKVGFGVSGRSRNAPGMPNTPSTLPPKRHSSAEF
jgi:curved DNA-binding protein CbpA